MPQPDWTWPAVLALSVAFGGLAVAVHTRFGRRGIIRIALGVALATAVSCAVTDARYGPASYGDFLANS